MSFPAGENLYGSYHTHPIDRAAITDTVFPSGFMAMWYGVAANVPTGWAICDGTNGTPDMRGRVPVGVDTGQTEFDTLGEAGGTKTHTLTTAQMPVHGHTQDAHNHAPGALADAGSNHAHTLTSGGSPVSSGAGTAANITTGGGGYVLTAIASTGSHPHGITSQAATNQNTGSGSAHSILQPYRALHFIMRV